MSKVFFRVGKEFCAECSFAIRRFIGAMDGVNDVGVENGMVSVEFDERRIDEEHVRTLTRDSIERLGYRVDAD